MGEYGWIVWVVLMIILSIVQSRNKAKSGSEARRKAAEQQAVGGAETERKHAPASASRPAGGRSLTQILEELAREASGGGASPDGDPSEVELAGAEEYDSVEYFDTERSSDWSGGVYSVEDADAEARYVGGEMGASSRHVGGEMGPAARYVGGESGATTRHSGGEMTQRRATLPYDMAGNQSVTTVRQAEGASGRSTNIQADSSEDGSANGSADDTAGKRLHDLFEGGFDLRRAVIEAEILTPKYIAKY